MSREGLLRVRKSMTVVALACAAVLAAWSGGRLLADSPEPSWPVTVEYTTWDAFGERSFRLEMAGWSDWRRIQTCCGDEVGMINEYRPDGSFWSGGLPGLPLTQDFVHEDRDGMAPDPSLAPRFPIGTEELIGIPFVRVLGEDDPGGEAVARSLGIERQLLVGLAVERNMLLESDEVPALDTYWIVAPLNLTVWHSEEVDGDLISTFEITDLVFGAGGR